MRGVILAFILLAGFPVVGQEVSSDSSETVTFDLVVERLSEAETLRGQFSQTRDVPALSAPLVSDGIFIVSELGLYWEQQRPFSSIVIADGETLSQKVTDQPPVVLSAEDQPMVSSIGQVLVSIFRGDRNHIERFFEIEFDASGAQWRMTLIPNSFPLNEAIEKIVIRGQRLTEQIEVYGTASDTLTVRFSNVRDQPPELSPDERALYSF